MTLKTPPALPPLLTAAQVAEWLCLAERAVLRMARAGTLPHVQLPNSEIMFDSAALLGWIDRQRVEAPPPPGWPPRPLPPVDAVRYELTRTMRAAQVLRRLLRLCESAHREEGPTDAA